jgi:hypothetical protein
VGVSVAVAVAVAVGVGVGVGDSQGSYSSAVARETLLYPPAASTLPEGSSVAV